MSEIINVDNFEVFDPEKTSPKDCEAGFIVYEIPNCNIDIEYSVDNLPFGKTQSMTVTFMTKDDISQITNKFNQSKPNSALLVIRNN